MGREKLMKMDAHIKTLQKYNHCQVGTGRIIRKAESVGAAFFIDLCALAFSW
jgi:hypothetical protein